MNARHQHSLAAAVKMMDVDADSALRGVGHIADLTAPVRDAPKAFATATSRTAFDLDREVRIGVPTRFDART
jgi:hypothetical protein